MDRKVNIKYKAGQWLDLRSLVEFSHERITNVLQKLLTDKRLQSVKIPPQLSGHAVHGHHLYISIPINKNLYLVVTSIPRTDRTRVDKIWKLYRLAEKQSYAELFLITKDWKYTHNLILGYPTDTTIVDAMTYDSLVEEILRVDGMVLIAKALEQKIRSLSNA